MPGNLSLSFKFYGGGLTSYTTFPLKSHDSPTYEATSLTNEMRRYKSTATEFLNCIERPDLVSEL